MSNGEKTGSKKPHYTQVMKDEIAALKKELEEARAQLETPVVTVNGSNANSSGTGTVTYTVNVPSEPVKVEDPLAWITDDTPAVHFVSSTSTFFLRHANPRANPPTKALTLQSTSDPRPWLANPFDYRNEDRIIEQNNQVMHARWHHLRLTADKASMYFEDPSFKGMTETVIDPKAYKGWNKLRKQPNGDKQPIAEFVPLRELARIILQKNDRTFLDWGPHEKDFDPRFPNPYNNRLPGVGSIIKRDLDAWAGKKIDSTRVQ